MARRNWGENTEHLSERAFTRQVLDLATLFNWRHYHNLYAPGSDRGWPDLVLVRGSCMILAELKSDQGKLSEAQENWLGSLREVAGLEVHVWRPSDWDEIVTRLR